MDVLFDHLLIIFCCATNENGVFAQYFKVYRILVRDKFVVYW